MGIVAYCPNGHRLKVKDQLAGRKGVCPTCGTSFRIPLASVVAEPPRSAALAPVAAEASLPVAVVVSLNAHVAATLPRALPLAVAPAAAEPGTRMPAASQGEALVDGIVESDASMPAVVDEAPEASWCIAVPGGAPSEPMSGEQLVRWLSSGSAIGTELVWRSDWSDWRPASEVFPDHGPSTQGGSRS
ncbi:MAG: GYF domain-containing protein [Pirellulales bacterium]